jgi:hypothetical protein
MAILKARYGEMAYAKKFAEKANEFSKVEDSGFK